MTHSLKKTGQLLLWAALLSLPSQSWAIGQIDMDEVNESSLPVQDADEAIDTAIDEYFNSRNITEGEIRKGGKVYYASKQVVSVGPESPQWAKARQLAYEKSLLEIRARFIFDNFGRTVSKAEQTLQRNDSTNNREFDEDLSGTGKIGALWDKAVALGEANLDKWLNDIGVDPAQYNAVPAAERKKLFVDRYVTTTISKAMGNSSGVLPVQTFEGSDDSGATVIGVVALYSPKLKQLASDISNQRAPILEGKNGKSISEYIDLPEETLASQFGVRVVFDSKGEPVVLSYGQWGYSYQGSNQQKIMRSRQTAANTADTKAREGLINFINSQLSLEDTSSTGDIVENYLQKRGEEITEKDISTIIDESLKNIKSKASARMAGTRIVKKWKYKDANGQEIIGRVRAWSESALNASKDVQNFKAQKSAKKSGNGKTGGGSVRSGATLMDPEEDF